MLSISSSKYSCLDRIKIPFLFLLIGKKRIKSLSITFSKNLAEDERKKLQTLCLELEREEDGVSEILGQVLPLCDQIFQKVYVYSVLSSNTIR
jgi:hypothetical protein